MSKAPSPLSRLTLAQYANRITLTCERLWQYPSTRPTFYHMAGAVLWMALCYQQENTLSENPRIRTPACVNMQKSYFLIKKVGRLVHSAEDELLSELETTSGASVRNNIWSWESWHQKVLLFLLFVLGIYSNHAFYAWIDGFINRRCHL